MRHDLPSGEIFETLDLPSEVDAANAEATFSNGILTVRLSQLAYLKPTPISVQSR